VRALLVFTPPASPFYTPLCIASLAAFGRQEATDCSIDLLDLNVATWHWVGGRETGVRSMVDFMRGRALSEGLRRFLDYQVQRVAATI